MTPCICAHARTLAVPRVAHVRLTGAPLRYFPGDSESKPAVLPTPTLPAAIFGQWLSSSSPVYMISVL